MPNDFTLTSITAYRWWDFTPRNDDGLNVPVYRNVGVSVRDKQYSQEIRLASPTGGFFDYVLGAYYFKQDLDNQSFFYYGPQADIWSGTPQARWPTSPAWVTGTSTLTAMRCSLRVPGT